MTVSSEVVGKVIRLVKQHTRDFVVPSVTEISKITGKDPFQVLISCLISLRTKDAVTIQASKRLFCVANTPQKLVTLSPRQIERLIYPAGFYKTKARRMKEICHILLDTYDGKVPGTPEELMSLPGVGRKTATITMVYGFGSADYIPVDTHVHRISNRLGWVRTKHPEETEQELMKVVPQKYWMDVNNLFVQFGQNICVPVSPRCSVCKASAYCHRVGVVRSR